MDASRWRRLAEEFGRLSALVGAVREQELGRVCNAQPDLAQELRAMLAADERPGTGLEPPPWPSSAGEPGQDRWIGRDVGGFVIEAYLASGGMGRVYRARQLAPERAVAIKTMAGHAPDFAQRLAFEAGLLARLDHPNIARVIAAGSGAPGQAWIAMELVEAAERLDQYAQNRALDARQKLSLLLQAVRGLEHAHNRGVLHRDLKPSNLLVSSDGRLKVIDFGVAAALGGPDGRLRGLESSSEELIGTLGYLAPEVLAGGVGQADVQSDVYGLGVVACELFCGPVPPSAALGGVLQEGASVSPFLGRALPKEFAPELGWLLAHALERQPGQRYASMSALAADLEALLAGRRLSVAPRALTYRLRHFCQHQPWQAAGIALAAGSFLAGTVALVLGYAGALRAIERERLASAAEHSALQRAEASASALLTAKQRAEGLAQARRSVGDFFVSMFGSLSPYARGTEVRVRDMLERSFQQLEEKPPADRGALALLYYAHGLGFQGLDDWKRSEAAFRQAEQLWARGPSNNTDFEQRASLPIHLAQIAAKRGDSRRALALFDLGLEQLGLLSSSRPLALALAARARLHVEWEQPANALADLEQALELRRKELLGSVAVPGAELAQHLALLELERLVVLRRLQRCSAEDLVQAAEASLSDLEVWGALEDSWRLPLAAVSGQVSKAAFESGLPAVAEDWAVREVEVRLACQNPQTLEVAQAAERALRLAYLNGETAQIARQRANLALTLQGFAPDWPLNPVETLLRSCGIPGSQEHSLAILDVGRALLSAWRENLPAEHVANLLVGRELGRVYQNQRQWAAAEATFAALEPALTTSGQWSDRAAIGLRRALCLAELLRLEESLALFDRFFTPWPAELGVPGSTEQLEYQLVHARVLLGTGQVERSLALAHQGWEVARAALMAGQRPVVRFQRLGDDFRQLIGRIELSNN
jgi:hypothetical protein